MSVPVRVPTTRFTYYRNPNMYVAEASDLPRAFDGRELRLVTRNGANVDFETFHVERDREGDLLYWDLRPTVPGHDVTLRVYND